jgi:hypothetical protein
LCLSTESKLTRQSLDSVYNYFAALPARPFADGIVVVWLRISLDRETSFRNRLQEQAHPVPTDLLFLKREGERDYGSKD